MHIWCVSISLYCQRMVVWEEVLAPNKGGYGGPPPENFVKVCLHLVVILAYSCQYVIYFPCLLEMDKYFFDLTKKVKGARELSSWGNRCAPLLPDNPEKVSVKL